ncbi:MAG: beta-galactosidase, partial [Bacteroidaceae bacterium]|nr:beta-galactosidase [Bacteroidaceae bacterium]
CYDGKEMIHKEAGPQFHGFRSISNDRRNLNPSTWQVEEVTTMTQQPATIVVKGKAVSADGKSEVPCQYVYAFDNEGKIAVSATFTSGNNYGFPRLGLQARLAGDLEQVRWLGRGPMENYPDRKDCAFIGEWTKTVKEMEEPYIKPQSMGERCDTKWLELTEKGSGKGIRITSNAYDLMFSALHYTDEDLWRTAYYHDLRNVRLPEVVLHLDAAMRGLGNGSCGPGPMEKYEITKPGSYTMNFTIERR